MCDFGTVHWELEEQRAPDLGSAKDSLLCTTLGPSTGTHKRPHKRNK